MRLFNSLKVAITYDRINKFGGAERVLLSLHKLFPNAPIYTLVHNPKKTKWTNDIRIIPSFFNHLPFFRTHHEILAPIAALGFESFNLKDFDIVISVTSAEAKSIITQPKTLHLCYCLTPTRYLWVDQENYKIPKLIRNYLKQSDQVYAKRPDYYLAISNEVKKRIKKYYNQNSEVIHPPINPIFSPQKKPISINLRNFYLCVSRLVAYKRLDLVIDAFNHLNLPLVIVGTGNQNINLRLRAKKNIIFKNFITDKELKHTYQKAKAVIFPQLEDFGLVPIEAQSCGTPVIAYTGGGALETIITQKTGIFFDNQNTNSLIKAIQDFETNNFQITPQKCFENSLKFSESRFLQEFSGKVKEIWQRHQQIYT